MELFFLEFLCWEIIKLQVDFFYLVHLFLDELGQFLDFSFFVRIFYGSGCDSPLGVIIHPVFDV